jgi:hypothetical protein
MSTAKQLLIILTCTAMVGCTTNRTQVKFSDGSVLTAKHRSGESFEGVRYVRKDHRVVTADSATVLKDRVVLTNAVVYVDGHQLKAEEYMDVVTRR